MPDDLSFIMTSANTEPTVTSLDGITLAAMVTHLVDTIGWDAMAVDVPIRCFQHDPSIKSSLIFLRRTPWARQRVEHLYLQIVRHNPTPRVDG